MVLKKEFGKSICVKIINMVFTQIDFQQIRRINETKSCSQDPGRNEAGFVSAGFGFAVG